MPIKNRNDAIEVESRIARIFAAPAGERAAAVRVLFAEALDFAPASGSVDLGAIAGNVALPASAERVAYSGGVHVVYIALDTPETDRVRKVEASAAARLVAEQLDGDLLLVFINTSASQLHLVYPSFERAQPVLRRLVMERELPRRTAVQQVSNIYWNHLESGSIRLALDRTFDVEPVTRDFFMEYKRVFEVVENGVSGFGDDTEARRRFVQTLFNRLMFVYFLSRKGWLTFKGDKDYLNALWSDYRDTEGEGKNFYFDRLRLLFFAGLNNYKSEDVTSEPEAHRLIGSVPFLNGGLFDMTDRDALTDIVLPDNCISEIFTKLFDRFNFTVLESSPFDVEVAVDPEMLGKVFEELVTGRHDSGAYYTPRPVVSFMCREALKGYVEGQDTGVTPEAIARFVDERDTSGISSIASARKVAEALDEVTVVDPACGSGAYLLGMMQELVDLQTALFNVGVDPKGLYDLKMHIIQRNLYGVDIDDFAVNIAMLRLWLSLAIEYEGETPPPLPNLDFKTLCGDSLLGPDPGAESYGDLFRHRAESAAARLAELKARYMKATTGKEALKGDIERVEGELREALADSPAHAEAIDWRVHFAEVFAQRGGFDIAIANPPYISVESLNVETKEHLFNHYETCEKRTDIYIGFMERSLSLINSGGFMSFIVPAAFTKQQYATKMRRKIIEEHAIRYLVDASSYRIFENAVVFNVILGVSREQATTPTKILIHRSNDDFENRTGIEFAVDQRVYAMLRDSRFDTNPSLARAMEFQEKAWRNAIPLGQICLISYGARLNSQSRKVDKAHYIHHLRFDGAKRFCEGHNIQRYSVEQEGWLNYRPDDHYRPVFPEVFENEKLMAINVVKDQLRFAYDNGGIYNSHTVINCVRLDLLLRARHRTAVNAVKQGDVELAKQFDYKYLLAVLNSTFTNWYFRSFLSESLHFYPNDAKELPIPQITAAEQRPFVRLVEEILAAKDEDLNADTSHLEWEIDRLVYDLYGLTEEEDTAIERSLGLIHATDEEEDAALARMMAEGLAEMRSTGEESNLEELREILRGWGGA